MSDDLVMNKLKALGLNEAATKNGFDRTDRRSSSSDRRPSSSDRRPSSDDSALSDVTDDSEECR